MFMINFHYLLLVLFKLINVCSYFKQLCHYWVYQIIVIQGLQRIVYYCLYLFYFFLIKKKFMVIQISCIKTMVI
jgi:hypothetical protein